MRTRWWGVSGRHCHVWCAREFCNWWFCVIITVWINHGLVGFLFPLKFMLPSVFLSILLLLPLLSWAFAFSATPFWPTVTNYMSWPVTVCTVGITALWTLAIWMVRLDMLMLWAPDSIWFHAHLWFGVWLQLMCKPEVVLRICSSKMVASRSRESMQIGHHQCHGSWVLDLNVTLTFSQCEL